MAATKVKRKQPVRHVSAPRAPKPNGEVDGSTPESENEWFVLRRSSIQGLGAFATRDIPRGTRIIEYTGEKISNAEADRRAEDEEDARHHTFLFVLNKKQVLDAK